MNAYWLQEPEAWRDEISAIEKGVNSPELWRRVVRLAGRRLSLAQIERLDRAVSSLFPRGAPLEAGAHTIRLAVLGSSTVSHLLPSIRVAALRRNLDVTTFTPNYGQYRQSLVGNDAALTDFQPNACLLALDGAHLLAGIDSTASGDDAAAAVRQRVEDIRSQWRQARRLFQGQIIQQTVLPPPTTLLGLNEHRLAAAPATLVTALNAALRSAADEEGVDLLAIDQLAVRDGISVWHDPALWHRAKQEISQGAAPLYGDAVARLLAASQGLSAKCLVLDLDNTLWGGVVGDDGLEGIVIGQGTAAGEAFAAFQHYAAELGRRGVILAVCSKNDEAVALEAFDRHPDMILRREDISAFRANWEDKATNLRALAAELNIGLDAMVFVDDNPFERTLVRSELPMVAVPELPDDPALFGRCISDAGYFETLRLTDEDAARTRQYRQNRQRTASAIEATDLGSYLKGLDMKLRWKHVDRLSLDRVAQLINKTNQFNVTTRRRSRDEVAALVADPRWSVLQFRLTDRFGDNGIIAVVIGMLNERQAFEIDSWLMSCRVLGRGVEEATLRVVRKVAQTMGSAELEGCYRPTPKNAMVADLFPRLGFAAMAANESEARYHLPTAATHENELPFTIIEDDDG